MSLTTRIFQSGLKLELFYDLLVRDIIMAKKEVDDAKDTGELKAEDRKDVIVISNSFNNSNNFYLSYVIRTIVELMIASTLFAYLVYKGHDLGVWNLGDAGSVMCDVYGHWYECSGHPQKFYLVVLIVADVLLFGYMLLTAITLLWISHPNMGAMSTVMEK